LSRGSEASVGKEWSADFSKVLRFFLRWFFKHLYTTLAWSYDWVAWIVSMGQWTKWLAVVLERLPAGMVLELGHGPGHLQARLGGRRWIPFGIDPSRQMSLLAAHRLMRSGSRMRLSRARAQNLPFAAGTFDALVSTFPSEYIMEAATLQEASRVLKPKGTLVVVPAARITGKLVFDRLAAWVNCAARQADDPKAEWLAALRNHGLEPVLETIHQRRAVVYRMIAVKKPVELGEEGCR